MAVDTNPSVDPGDVNQSDTPGITITENNKYKGTFTIEAIDSLIDSINAEADTELEKGLGITFDAIGTITSVVDFADNPGGTIIGAAIGWLIEHVDALRRLLDAVGGDVNELNSVAATHVDIAIALRVVADRTERELAKYGGWEGEASQAYQGSMSQMVAEVRSSADAADTHAKLVKCIVLVITVGRDLIRDLLAKTVGDIASNIIFSGVATFMSAGISSLGGGTAKIAKKIAEIVTKVGVLVGKIVKLAITIGKLIEKLQPVLTKLKKNWGRFDNIADVGEVGFGSYQATKDVNKKTKKASENASAKDEADDALSKVKNKGKTAEDANTVYENKKKQEKIASDNLKEKAKKLDDESKEFKEANEDAKKAADKADKAAKVAEERADKAEEEAREAEKLGKAAEKHARDVEKYGDQAEKYANEAEKAADRGDKQAFETAKQKYEAAYEKYQDALGKYEGAKGKYDGAMNEYDSALDSYKEAKGKYDDANDYFEEKKAIADREHKDVAKAAADYSTAAHDYYEAANSSNNAFHDTKAPFDDAVKASDEFQTKYGQQRDDIADSDLVDYDKAKAAAEDLDQKIKDARTDQEAFEKANQEAASMNAQAAEANAKALRTGDAKDIADAEHKSSLAKAANTAVETAASTAQTSADEAKKANDYYKSLDKDFELKKPPGTGPADPTIKKAPVEAL